MKKKHIAYLLASLAIAGLSGSCADEEWVTPTAQRSGITSLAAYFTSGNYVGKEAIDWKIANSADITDFVIPVPYWYPEESDNTTEAQMTAMKVTATLENNCMLEPALGVLDLTKKNAFVYTDADGTRRNITISGAMTKPAGCAIKAFTSQPGGVNGVIDEDNKTISLVTAADLAEETAEVTLSPHASISPDPAVPHNFNDGFEFTVTAANTTDKAVYKVMKQIPPKIANGFRSGSATKMFENDMTTLGVTDAGAVHPTLACLGSYVVLNLGNGSAPQYFKKTTGKLVGKVNLGTATATGAITSDNAGNMLICNYAASGSTLKIFKTTDVTKSPELLITYDNNLGISLGSRLHVQGDLQGNAVVTATAENSNNYVRWMIRDGKPGQAENIGMTGIAKIWGSYDNIGKVVSRSDDGSDGVFVDFYQDGSCPLYYAPDGIAATQLLSANSNEAGWGYNTGAIDARDFNHARYLAIFEMGYWPNWGLPGTIYLYDATTPANLSGALDQSAALKYRHPVGDSFGSIGYAAGDRFGDVLMTPSADGYFMYVYYASNTHLSFGGFQVDCIDK